MVLITAIVLGAVLGTRAHAQSSSASSTSTTSSVYPQGSQEAPFPDTVYPGFQDPITDGGAVAGQSSPPKYPSPWMDGSRGWSVAYAKAQAFVKQLTLIEKVNITTGVGWEGEQCVGNNGAVPRLGFRAMCMQDSPLGVRLTDYNSAFPAGVTIAATWSRAQMYLRGNDMGSEHRQKGVDVQLGPVVGPLGRSPEGGRNWEGFSPDPVLSGIAVAETVKGIQDAGVVACTKHFIFNEQEHFRQSGDQPGGNVSEALSSNVDDVTLHELYLWPFADAVRAGTGAIMCSYNQVNNSYSCANSYLLNYILKGELGFQGFIMSDWQAQHSGVSTALAGLDMTMPGDEEFVSGNSFWGANLTVAVLNGTVPEWRIDDMATRILSAWYYVGRDKTQIPVNFDSWTLDTYGWLHQIPKEGYQQINGHVDVRGNHGSHIRTAAAMGTVLLKNTGAALPLSGHEKFTAIFGEDSGSNSLGPNGCSDHGCDMGTMAQGWGSGTAAFPYLVTPMQAITNLVETNGGVVQGMTDNYNYAVQATLAQQASVCLVFANADAGEGYITVDGNTGDRNNLTLWGNADKLIMNVANNCNNTVVIMHTPGPVLVGDWNNHTNITAIVWAGVPGQESGNSIADILYGKVNPGGKLPFTLGRTRKDYGTDLLYKPNNGAAAPQIQFTEGVFIDYRTFDKFNETPVYEFGYGLSYTTFSYSNLQIQNHGISVYKPTTGMTLAAPVLGTPGNAADYVFPAGFHQVPTYIYPYLNSTNLKMSSGDPMYGLNSSTWLPAHAQDGSAQPLIPAGGGLGGNPQLYDVLFTVNCTITNTGTVVGDEVPQLYLSLGGPNDPKVVLRNFDRITIQPNASATFSAGVTRRDISNWDTVAQNWFISKYPKMAYVGSSSRKLMLSGPLLVGTSLGR